MSSITRRLSTRGRRRTFASELLEPRHVLDSTVVFNEIMYHPADNNESLEWIELHNQMTVDIDMSAWSLQNDVRYQFAKGTVLKGGRYLVIAADPAAFTAATGIANVFGPFDGRLSNAGGLIELRNHTNRLMNEFEYDDAGDWPVSADGSGVSLAKFDPQSATEFVDNWRASDDVGGTPGRQNFATPSKFDELSLIAADATWRFNQSGADPGAQWRTAGYDDSQWESGKALFFAETMPLPGDKNTPVKTGQWTYYFRTTFDYDGDASDAKLLFRHIVDDGAVFYVNGQEVSRFTMPDGPVDNSTPASRAISDATLVATNPIPAEVLMKGSNIVAVEVHQTPQTSNDVVFGAELVLQRPRLQTQPTNHPLLSEVPSGDTPTFWIELANSGSTPLSLAGYVLRKSGTSQVDYVFQNQSIPANGFITFDERQLGFRAVPGEQLFLYSPDRRLVIDSVSIDDRLQGRLPSSGAATDSKWLYPDTSTPGQPNHFEFHDEIVINEVMYNHRPKLETPAEIEIESFIAMDSMWKYEQSGNDLGTAWRQPSFDDSAWPAGKGLFYNETAPLPGPKNTPINTGISTHYFRTTFQVDGDPAAQPLAIRHVVDDGAVFYINGTELARYNMPGGEIAFDTRASSVVPDGSMFGPIAIPANLLVRGTNAIAVEVHQTPATSSDVAFGVELVRTRQISPAIPYAESDEEWIELYNRDNKPVDLSGFRLSDAADFRFPTGTTLAPGEYLVVSSNAPKLSLKYPDVRIVGSFGGTLSNRYDRIRLHDERGNVADEVYYYDAGRWPEFADGGGSSLELRDPHADNSNPAAWASSDESRRSPWRHYDYTRIVSSIIYDPPINFNEFVMSLLSAGEVLVDNISVVHDPAGAKTELIQNGTFDVDPAGEPASKWRIQGTHEDSRVIDDPDKPGNRVLRLASEARTSYMSNHAETTLVNNTKVVNGETYRISFDAKWIAGSAQLHTELYYKDAARTSILEQPTLSGTPGRQNSVYVSNIGPTYHDLRHEPVIPDSQTPVIISVAAQDEDSVAGLELRYSLAGGEFVAVPMTRQSDGRYAGQIPAQPDSTIVQFYVHGQDAVGAVSQYPAAGPDSRALYRVRDNYIVDTVRHDFQIIMTRDETTALHRNVNWMNNNRYEATVIYDGRDVFYDVGVRMRGSMFTRQNQAGTGYNVRFLADQRFRGVHETISFDQGRIEITVKHLITASGNLGGTYDDIFRLVTPSGTGGGPTLAYLARHDDVFLREQFENGEEGMLFKFEGIRVMEQTVDRKLESLKVYMPIGWVANFDIANLGDDKELYRWPFLANRNRDQDDYSKMIQTAKAFSLSGDELESAVSEVLDVDQWMSTFALMSLAGIGDAYGQGNPHNLNIYVRPSDNKVLAFPWDWDFVFSQVATAPLIGNQNIGKVIRVPTFNHLFLGHMHHTIQTAFNSQYMSYWNEHYGGLLRENYATNNRRIDLRVDFVKARLPAEVPFSINADQPNSVDGALVKLTGTGWINVRRIRVQGQSDFLPVKWTDLTNWEAVVPLQPGTNQLTLEAIDFDDRVIASPLVQVVSTANRPLLEHLRISEIMYHPASASIAEAAAGWSDDDHFEFIELVNTSTTQTLDLTGVRFTDGVEYTFPQGQTLGPAGRSIVAKTTAAFRMRNGEAASVAGQFEGRLSNDGESLRLVDPEGITILEVTYGDSIVWPESTDGLGASLQAVDVGRTPRDQFAKFDRWRASTEWGGSPGLPGAAPAGIVINEILSNPTQPQSDAIELLNVTSGPIDVSGWYVSDSAQQLRKYAIPAGTVIGPGQYLVLDEAQFNPRPGNPGPHDFAISGIRGDDVWLVQSAADGTIQRFIDEAHFPAAVLGEPFGRVPNGHGLLVPLQRISFGRENSASRVGPVLVSEVHYHPAAPSPETLAIASQMTADDLEFVELWNPTLRAVDLSGWQLQAGIEFEFPTGTTLPVGRSMIVAPFNPASPDNAARALAFRTQYGLVSDVLMIGGYGGRLYDDQDVVWLLRPERPPQENSEERPLVISDVVLYDDVAPWPASADGAGQSLSRRGPSISGHLADNWSAGAPTPGSSIVAGDFNGDGQVRPADIDLLCQNVRFGDGQYDLNRDGLIDGQDVAFVLSNWLGTSVADVNLDGLFDLSDLTRVLTIGEYEDSVVGNSLWSEGDWNCDGDFTTRDLVLAWQDSGYINSPAATLGRITLRDIGAAMHGHSFDNQRDDFPGKSRSRLTVQHARLPANAVDQAMAETTDLVEQRS